MSEDQAPWMHETMHLLIASRRGDWFAESEEAQNAGMPLWLEGLAESLSIDVDQSAGLAHYSPVTEVPAGEIDQLCRERLEASPAARISPSSEHAANCKSCSRNNECSTRRRSYAASTSFVRHLQRKYGLRQLLQAIDCHDCENEQLERSIGTPLKQAKDDWLDAIGYRDQR